SSDIEASLAELTGSQGCFGVVVRVPRVLWVHSRFRSEGETPLISTPAVPAIDDGERFLADILRSQHAGNKVGFDHNVRTANDQVRGGNRSGRGCQFNDARWGTSLPSAAKQKYSQSKRCVTKAHIQLDVVTAS